MKFLALYQVADSIEDCKKKKFWTEAISVSRIDSIACCGEKVTVVQLKDPKQILYVPVGWEALCKRLDIDLNDGNNDDDDDNDGRDNNDPTPITSKEWEKMYNSDE